MSEKPILFSSEMVRAILEGRKSQTRRVIRLPGFGPCHEGGWEFRDSKGRWQVYAPAALVAGKCPYGRLGDRLWVRETWRAEELDEFGEDGIRYQADNHFKMIENTREAADLWGEAHRAGNPWRPSIYMPRWASRITLEITGVRVQKLRQITNDDACAEGVESIGWLGNSDLRDFRTPYGQLWDKINKKRGFGWDVNPWVWVIEFRRVK